MKQKMKYLLNPFTSVHSYLELGCQRMAVEKYKRIKITRKILSE